MLIGLLEDEPAHAALLRSAIESLGHDVIAYIDGSAMLRELQRRRLDALVIDWQVPGVSGIEVVRWVRRHFEQRVPVVFVTSRDTEEDIIEGLDSGADDYLVKPFRRGELLARLRAVLRRAYPDSGAAPDVFGAYRFDTRQRQVFLADAPVELKPKEYELALYLFRNQGRLLAHDELLVELWGVSHIDTRTVATHISQLRRKLDLRPHRGFRIVPVYGAGYRLEAIAQEEGSAS
ncbi:response regulator transcription factor [Verticiella sediminum]|uniref:Response regulator transcription factor n=1 Tax=Verticiella sediminum TaxID=1247510 RepID=A0A556AIN5_9BURK|nr:response regulator transcription factor [Verticiella sediminum]TSH92725.1 response regulator transcription factor [Verticiella sediminum]